MQDKSPNNIIGPDINEYRGDVNYTLLATRTSYCYLRASGSGTGRFRVDRKFFEYVRGLRSVGILSGGYHYAVPSNDLTTADSQCDDFINVLQEAYGPGNYGELMPVIDVEAPREKSISTDTLLDWVDRFRKRFERKTRRRLMIYTGAFFIDLYNNFYHSRKGYVLSDMPLWIAMYPEIPGNPPYPRDAGGWTRWLLWQFTENGEMAGIQPPVDLNYGPTNLDYLTQPRDVRNLKAYGDDRNIYVSWDRNTDVDLNGYNIFLNSEYVGTVGKNATSHTIRLDNPNKNARYEVGVEAFDVTGDFSQNRAKTIVMLRHVYDEMEDNYVNGRHEKEKKCKCLLKNYDMKDSIKKDSYSKDYSGEWNSYKQNVEEENYEKNIAPKGEIKHCSCYKKHINFNYGNEQDSSQRDISPINYNKSYSDYKKDIDYDNYDRGYGCYKNCRKFTNYDKVNDFYKNSYENLERFNSNNGNYNNQNEIYEDYNYYKDMLNNNSYRNKYEIYYDENDGLYYYPVKIVSPQNYMKKMNRNKEEYSPVFKYTLEEEENEFDDFEYEKELLTEVFNVNKIEYDNFKYGLEVEESNIFTMDYGEEFEFVRGYYEDDFEDYEENHYDNFHNKSYIQEENNIIENYIDYDRYIDENMSNIYTLYNCNEEDYTEYERNIDEEYDFDVEYRIEDEDDYTREEEYNDECPIEEYCNDHKYEYEYEYETRAEDSENELRAEDSENELRAEDSENELREEDNENKLREENNGYEKDLWDNEENQDRTPYMENESENERKCNTKYENSDDIKCNKEKEVKDCDDKYHYQYLKENKKTIKDWDDAHYKHWYENHHCKDKSKKKKKKHHKKHKR